MADQPKSFLQTHLWPSIGMAAGVIVTGVGYASDAYQIWTAGLKPWAVQLCGVVVFAISVISLLVQAHRASEARFAGLAKSQPQPTVLPAPPVAPAGLVAALRSAGRQFVAAGVTVARLAEIGEGHTSSQAERLYQPFIGKWIKVPGRINDIGTLSNGERFVHLDTDTLGSSRITLVFGQKWADQLDMMRRGDPVTVVGEIEGVDFTISLINCEIVDD